MVIVGLEMSGAEAVIDASGQDRRKLSGPQYIGVWKDVEVNELMRSQNASGVPPCLGKLRVLILECPFPDKTLYI